MSVTDAEKAFYESVIAAPDGHSIQDLRYTYFLAALDGSLPPAAGTVDQAYVDARAPFLPSQLPFNAASPQPTPFYLVVNTGPSANQWKTITASPTGLGSSIPVYSPAGLLTSTAAPTGVSHLANKGYVDNLVPARAAVPASATAAGDKGQIAVEAGFLYVCVATNSWQRVALAAW